MVCGFGGLSIGERRSVRWRLAAALNVMLRRFPGNTTGALIAKYDGYVFYYLAAFLVMGYILRKRFQHFRIVLLSNHGDEGATPLPPSLYRTARVWWTFTWRSLIHYRVIAAFAGIVPVGMDHGVFDCSAARTSDSGANKLRRSDFPRRRRGNVCHLLKYSGREDILGF